MLDKIYAPQEVEGRLYDRWESAGAFKCGQRPDAEPFCIVIPPPNVTGSLHMGHALNNTIQDILIRFERMRGKDVLWQPGMDHAGIATQMVVERQLESEGDVRRQDLGREEFVNRVWQWKEKSGGMITQQLRRLGASCDWSRERFTMDEGLSRAVLRVFIQLYKEGLIYKDKRLVNWDPKLLTAISDLEVEQVEEDGHLWHFKYPIEGEEGSFITVATTRPETMLGDTGVAVHPDDERYKHLIGKFAVLPLVGRRIPIVADHHADPEQGSGAVKITPAHDKNDFEVRRRHDLDVINILDEHAAISIEENLEFWKNTTFSEKYDGAQNVVDEIGGFHDDDGDDPGYKRYGLEHDPELEIVRDLGGLDRFEAREKIIENMKALGLLEKVEDHRHVVPYGDRSHVVIEFWLTDQWYVDAKTLAQPAIKAVEDGDMKFVPKNWERTYFEWMRNIQPWCISRQLWWGHRVPAWYGPIRREDIDNATDWSLFRLKCFVAENEEELRKQTQEYYVTPIRIVNSDEAKKEFMPRGDLSEIKPLRDGDVSDPLDSKSTNLPVYVNDKDNENLLVRDEDVLDTWFSSALWPFSTLGWPGETPELERYYKTDVLVTGFDIIFFWVARMMMMGLHFMPEAPFQTTYIHALVRDEKGAKMSKSKGNIIDPLELIDKYGADALRFTLAAMAAQGRDIKLSESRIEGYRNFGTKLWNAARFCEMNECIGVEGFNPSSAKQTVNRWIAGEIQKTAAAVTLGITEYKFNEAASAIYHFIWHVFCDWYLEFIKPLLNGTDEEAKVEARAMCAWVLDQSLILLHPFMPFMTEELWQLFGELGIGRDTMLILASWPDDDPRLEDAAADGEMNWLMELVNAIRSVRALLEISPQVAMVVGLESATTPQQRYFLDHKLNLEKMTKGVIDLLATNTDFDALVQYGASYQHVMGNIILHVTYPNFDYQRHRRSFEEAIAKISSEIGQIDVKLSNEKFMARAPEDVIEEQHKRKAEAKAKRSRLTDALKRLKGAA